MKRLTYLLTGFAMLCFFSCASAAENVTATSDYPAVSLAESAPADVSALRAEDTITYTMQDAENLQCYLLTTGTADLSDKSYDLNGDGQWTAVDLTMMKHKMLPETHSDTLVVYFSRTGNTRKIAQYLVELTGADSYVIEAAVPYTDEDIRYQDESCRANREQNDKTVRPEIAQPLASIDGYDTVFLGYPIWWGQEPRIIDTFLESLDFSDKTVIPFCTSGSSDIGTSAKNIAELVPIGKQLAGKRFSADADKNDVKAWYDTLPLHGERSAQTMNITVNGTTLKASLSGNSSAQALSALLSQGNITVDMSDYGNFEKVGNLPQSLPTNDEKITTTPGDIILYQGDKITIYYAENTWNFTKLGHIDNITQAELKAILGSGDVTVTFSA